MSENDKPTKYKVTIPEDGPYDELKRNALLDFHNSSNFGENLVNPLVAVRILKKHLQYGLSLPSYLAKWLSEGFDEHEKNFGEKKLDEIWGFSNKESQRNVYTEAKITASKLVPLVQQLLDIVELDSKIIAARLVLDRVKVTDITPDTLRDKHKKAINDGDIKPRIISESYNHFHLMDEMVLRRYSDMPDTQLYRSLPTDLEKIHTAIDLLQVVTPIEYHENLLNKN